MVFCDKSHHKTKILITNGPSIEQHLHNVINLIDGVRFNMSHAKREDIERVLDILNKYNIAKLMDLRGIKIRIVKTNIDEIKEGGIIHIGKDIKTSYHPVKDVKVGNTILINDGKIKLKVIDIENNKNIVCKVIVGGIIKEGMGVNFPDTHLDISVIPKEDLKNIKYAIDCGFEYIALSFVRNEEDVNELRDLLWKYGGGDISIISKIETKEGLNNISEIAKCSDGVMVARGDLGVELPIEYIPIEQKNIINTTNKYGKISITATQMLDSMVNNPYPTRAEITDIANAIFDGTDCLMLSNETSIGKYPVEAIKVMRRVAMVSEKNINKFGKFATVEGDSISTGIAHATHTLYEQLKPNLIITPTWSGKSAILVSKFKPDVPIVAITPDLKTFRKLKLAWNIVPCLRDEVNSIEDIFNIVEETAKNYISEGTYITTLGHPMGHKMTNLIKVGHVFNESKKN